MSEVWSKKEGTAPSLVRQLAVWCAALPLAALLGGFALGWNSGGPPAAQLPPGHELPLPADPMAVADDGSADVMVLKKGPSYIEASLEDPAGTDASANSEATSPKR